MTTVSMRTKVNTSAAKLWEIVSDFNGLPKFLAAATKSTMEGSGVGAFRTLTLADGTQIVEKLESLDEQTKSLSYSIVSGPLPVENYVSTMKVLEISENQSEFEWSSSFEPKGVPEAEAKKTFEDIYSMGFDGLKNLFGD
ncbi:MAG: SRPBCC family protein [Candidatus Hodarchaeota archaeon]